MENQYPFNNIFLKTHFFHNIYQNFQLTVESIFPILQSVMVLPLIQKWLLLMIFPAIGLILFASIFEAIFTSLHISQIGLHDFNSFKSPPFGCKVSIAIFLLELKCVPSIIFLIISTNSTFIMLQNL